MTGPFRASYLKLERAAGHFQELEAAVTEFFKSEPMKITPAQQVPGMISFGGVEFKGISDATSAIIGDVIHNLRAALDLMAVELCVLNKQSGDDVYFPFCENADYLPEMIKKKHFDRAGPEAVKLLMELRPYKGGNVALRAIHDLDIQDKHQSLIPTVMNFTSPTFKVELVGGKPTGIPVGDPAKPGEIKLVMPAGCAIAGQEVLPGLHGLVETAASVVESFKALKAPAG